MSSTPEPPEYFSLEDGIALYAPNGEVSLEAAVDMISTAILYCRDNEIEGLLIDVRELFGFTHPSVVDRYWFARKWATDAGSQVVLSFIQRPEMIDPEQIGITIAANAGLVANVSDNEADARTWLAANIKVAAR
jgi:hypothetical protein